MCLQWCHVRTWLINNDLACTDCMYGSSERLSEQFSCATCTHGTAQAGTAGMCGLTRETLPVAGRCCHWSVTQTVAMTLVLSDADLAPWLRGQRGVAGVFDESDTAPEVIVDRQRRVTVRRDELSVPLVYGVPSPEWDGALGWEPVRQTLGPEVQPMPDVDALMHVLECIPHGGPLLITALNVLVDTLSCPTMLCTDDAWRNITIDMLVLCREQHGAQPAIQQALQRIEDAVCI